MNSIPAASAKPQPVTKFAKQPTAFGAKYLLIEDGRALGYVTRGYKQWTIQNTDGRTLVGAWTTRADAVGELRARVMLGLA